MGITGKYISVDSGGKADSNANNRKGRLDVMLIASDLPWGLNTELPAETNGHTAGPLRQAGGLGCTLEQAGM